MNSSTVASLILRKDSVVATSSTISPMAALESSYDTGHTAWVLTSTALVWLMIPGVGYFYSGMAQSKNALSLIMLSLWSVAVVLFQWFLFGYSLTFSKKGNFLIGHFDHVALLGVATEACELNPKIPALTFCIYQGMFAAITPALAIGASAERARILPALIFIFLWTTFVYDFIAYWTWNPRGWGALLGGLDFAGGTPVHISSGAAALAYAVVLGHRVDKSEAENPHNMISVVLGTTLIWFGWFGFNGGSALASGTRATLAIIVTNIAAAVGGAVWTLMDYRTTRKFSALGFCTGAVAGLVCITPASGFVDPSSSVAFGILGAAGCHVCMKLKHWLHYDDALDVFAVHGIGGIIGNLLTAVFAQKAVAALDGTKIEGGWIDGHWMQMAYQLADTAAGFSWSLAVTFIMLTIMNKIPGLSLRVSPEEEAEGLDAHNFGFSGYEYMRKSMELGLEYKNASISPTGEMTVSRGQRLEVATEMLDAHGRTTDQDGETAKGV